MQKRQFDIEVSQNRTIRGDIFTPEYPEGKPLVIFCHGFKGFKNWGEWQFGMEKICNNGFYVIAFNFSYNGIGTDLQNFGELNKFEQNTIGKELEDLDILVGKIDDGEIFPEIKGNPKKGIIGHSRGGGTAILFASQSKKIDCIVTWASISSFDNYLSRGDQWRKDGFIEFENARTKQIMRMNVEFLNDLERSPLEKNILRAESSHGLPHLILHGDKDEAVPLEEAQKLLDASNKSASKMEIIPEGTHTFGQSHPASSINPVFDTVLNKSIEWFRNHFN